MTLEELEDFHKSLDDQFSVPEEEREAAIATLEVGKYKGDDPLPFRKKPRKEFDKLKGERHEVISNVHAAQQFKKDLEAQYTPLNRAKRFFKDLFSPDAAVSKPRDSPKSSQVATGSTQSSSALPTLEELPISKPAPKASASKPKTRKPVTREYMERQMVEAGQHFDLPAPSILDAYKQMPGMAEISNMTEQRNAKTLMEAQRPGAKSLIPPKGPGFQDPQQEAKFQKWYKQNFASRGLNPNPDDPQHFYDYRGAFKAGMKPGDDGHMDSRFKLPGHPRTYVDTPEGRLNTVTGKIVGKPQPGTSIIGMDGEAIPLPDDLPAPQEDVLEVPEVHVTGTMPTPGELASQWTEDLKKTGRELMEAPPVQSVGQGFTEAAHNFMQGLAAMPAGALKSIAIASKSLDRIIPDSLKDDRPIEERGTYKLGTEIDKLAKRLFPTDPAMQKNFIVGVLPRAVGSMTGFLAGGVAGAVAKAPVTATAILGASVGGADQFEEAKARNAAPDVQEKAFWLGSAVGSSEALPIAGIINRFNKATGGRFVQVLKESGVTAAQEFIQEYFQQTGSNVVAQQLYDENRSWFEGAGMGGTAGGGSGAIVGFLSGVLQSRKARRDAAQPRTDSPLFTEPEAQSQVSSLPDELNITQPGQRPPFLMKQPQAPSVTPSPVPPPEMATQPPSQESGGRPLQAPTPEMVQPAPVAPGVDIETDGLYDSVPEEPASIPEEPMRAESPIPTPEMTEPVEMPDAVYAHQGDEQPTEPQIIETRDGRFKVQLQDGTFLTNPVTGGTEFKTEAKARAAIEKTIDVKPKQQPKAVKALPAPVEASTPTPNDVLEVPEVRVEGERPTRTVDDIHKLAEEKGIPWDEDPAFMDLTEQTTGKRQLDHLSPEELERMAIVLEIMEPRKPIIRSKQAPTPDQVVDRAAQQAATSSQNDLTEPTPAQKEAGNYKKGKVRIAGLDISIENPEGSTRSGTDTNGKPWSVKMKSHYGYILDTVGKDKDHIDVFVKPGTSPDYSGTVYIVDQIDPTTKKFDEHKTILGAESIEEAKQLYRQNYTKGWKGLGSISALSMQDFKAWVKSNKTKQPFSRRDAPTQALTPDDITTPQVQLPRSELPAEDNAEMLLRAEKAQADLEIAGKETGRRKVFNYDVQGQGGTPEVTGLQSAAPDWYRDLTTGPRPLKRAQIETAIQKIIKDDGVDVGGAVERVKEALLRDREFNKTPWGADADAIARGEWPSWIEKPTAKTQQAPTPDEAFLQPQEMKSKPAKKAKAEQTSIPVPPETIGSRPIIGREVAPEEAPLFSKAAQVPTPEQTVLAEPKETTPKEVAPKDKQPIEPAPVKAKEPAPKPTPKPAKPSAYALDTIDKMYRKILDDTKAVHHLRRGNKEAWARVKKIDALMKEGQTSGLDYDEAAAKIPMEDLDALADILESQTTKKEEPITALASPIRKGDNRTMATDQGPGSSANAQSPPEPGRNITNTPAFKEWFGNSKVVDKNGKPIVVYHGTNDVIETFDPKKRGEKTRSSSANMAFFFTDNIRTAQHYLEAKALPTLEENEAYARAVMSKTKEYRKEDFGVQYQQYSDGEIFGYGPDEHLRLHNRIRGEFSKVNEDIAASITQSGFMQEPDPVKARPLLKKALRAFYPPSVVDAPVGYLGLAQTALTFESRAGAIMATNEEFGIGNHIIGAFLRMENPKIYTFKGGKAAGTIAKVVNEAITQGFDGVIFRNVDDGGPVSTHYAVFSNDQIKQASPNPSSPQHGGPKDTAPITDLAAPDRTAKRASEPSPARELADLFKQESESYTKKKTPKVPRIPVDPIMGGESATLSDIILNLEKGAKQKVTVGKTGRNLGLYKPGSTATMIRYSGDLDTTAHEMAHALDDRYGLVKEWKGQDTSPYDTELDPFAEHTSLKGYSPTQRRAEGVAEFMRAWMVNPKAAEAAAPQFTAHMKAQLPADIQKALTTFSTQVRQWAGNSAHAKIMANVEWDTPETGMLHWLSGTRTAKGPGFQLTIGDQIAKRWTDRLSPFVKALDYVKAQRGEESVLPGDDPLLLARLYMGANAKLDDIFAHGMINERMERATPGGLTWLLEPFDRSSEKTLDQDMQAAASLMIAERTLEKTAQLQRSRVSGIGAGIEEDVSVARARIEEMQQNPEQFERVKEAANRYRQWADANLRYLVEKGRLSEEQYETIKTNNEQYVAMQRILEVSPGEDLALTKSGSPSNQLGSVKQPIKQFKGSSKAIKNPFLSLMDATNHSVREADRNEIMKLFRDLLTTDRGLYGESQSDFASVGRIAKEGEKQTIPIYVNGKKEVWQFHPDVYAALKGIGSNEYRLPLALTILPRILRATITNAPPFALRNVIRDSFHRSIVSLTGSKPWDTLKRYSKDEISQLKRSGGDQAGFYYKDTESYARAMKFAMEEAVHSTNSIVVDPAKLMTMTKKGGKWYLDLMQSSERQGRLAEYRKAFTKAQKEFGHDDYHASLYAAGQSRSLIDYAVAGEWMQTINQLIPFSNAAVQGMRMTMLRAKADPSGYALRFGAYAVLPSLMAYAWNYLYGDGDDLEEYRQLPAYQRDLFWNFKLGPDLWLKVPKPFENGVVSTTIERAVDYALGNEKAFDGHGGSLAKTLLPIDEASFAGPYQAVFQAAANYDFFRDRPIVPRWEENLELELRNYNRASRLGQALQQAIGVDARKIDFVINQQFGYLGRYAADISDAGRKDRHGLALSSTGMVGYSPAAVSLDAKKVAKIAEERGLVPSRAKIVDRLNHVKEVRDNAGKHPDSLRYAVFRKHLNEYYKAESREERDRLAALVRDEAKFLRTRWEKTPPREEATEKAGKKRAERTKDPLMDLMGLDYTPISKHPVKTLPELTP